MYFMLDGWASKLGSFLRLHIMQNCLPEYKFIPDGIMDVAVTVPIALEIFGVSSLLTGVVATPVFLAAIISSVLVDPLPD